MPALYDTFLIQEPLRQDPFAVTHNPSDRATLIGVYSKSIDYFGERDRRRAVERLRYELGVLYTQDGEWKKALKILEPLWREVSWRKEGWWELLGGLGVRVRECAWKCGDRGTVVRCAWEGMSNYGMENLESKPRIVVRAGETVSYCTYVTVFHLPGHSVFAHKDVVSFTFGFGAMQGNVGEPLPAQVVITSHARRSTAPVTLSHFSVSFDGGLKDIRIEHQADTEPIELSPDNFRLYAISLSTEYSELDLSNQEISTSDSLLGMSNLTFHPDQMKVFSFSLIPKDSGTVRVANIISMIETESFDLEYTISGADYVNQDDYWFKATKSIGSRPASNVGVNGIRIHPKPPKMEINIPQLRKDFLTDEIVRLEIEIRNEEDDDAEVALEARFLGQADTVPTWMWITIQEDENLPEDLAGDQKQNATSSYDMGHIERSGSRKVDAMFTAKALATEAVLEIKANYHVLADPDTPISKVLVHEITVDRPFEAICDFQPCVDASAMPSYFDITEDHDNKDSAQGLRQSWKSTARVVSYATEPLVIKDVVFNIKGVQDGAVCRAKPSKSLNANVIVGPEDFHECEFDINAQKLDLDDRRSTAIQLQLEVRWRRNQPNEVFATTTIAAPDLVIPFGEPRVLAAAGLAQGEDSDFVPLDYTIENPSTHVLSFDISMETKDDFAFSGPKTASLQLVPMSRHTLRYNIVPLVRGKWITPNLRILDTHFNQVLKINGTRSMRTDKTGASFWVDAAE
ncbi:MAG: hypothetical protein Q9170_007390 [Blastenia crenularia]